MRPLRFRHRLNRLFYLGLTVATAAMDAAPARVRFGHGRTISRLLFDRQPLARIEALPVVDPGSSVAVRTAIAGVPELRCTIATASLDVGGVESVVAMIARRLPLAGIASTVVARQGGRTADKLRAAGVPVHIASSDATFLDIVPRTAPDVVEVHTATPAMSDALVSAGIPIVSVLHSVELYREPSAWEATARLDAASRSVVAVSRAVRDDHVAHVPLRHPDDVVVIPNGAETRATDGSTRARARDHLAAGLRVDLANDVVVVCLARYDIQKNITGLVDAFLLALRRRPHLRLVVAGGTADWLERTRAEVLRRADRNADRVHLLAESDAATLLAAADVFAIDSFFEGWPVSVTEAVCTGLPVVMADVGGAHELIGEDPTMGRVVANPAGPTVTPATVAAARRAVHQQTRRAFAQALVEVSDLPRNQGRMGLGHEVMAARHAEVLRAVARAELVGR